MNRRGFLKFLGAFAASSALPALPAEAKIAESRRFNLTSYVLFSCSPLSPGTHTISWYEGDKGLFVGGVEATGGETLVKVWTAATTIEQPSLSKDGIYFPHITGHFDFADPETFGKLQRGKGITKL